MSVTATAVRETGLARSRRQVRRSGRAEQVVGGRCFPRMAFAGRWNGLILGAWLALGLLAALGSPRNSLAECQEQVTVESRQQKDNEDLTATIKYLESLDKIFSQMARPRFGRSEFKQRGGGGPLAASRQLHWQPASFRPQADFANAALALGSPPLGEATLADLLMASSRGARYATPEFSY